MDSFLLPLGLAFAAGAAGGFLSLIWTIPGKWHSLLLHFSAGMLVSVIAVDLLPDVRTHGEPVSVLIGFAGGSAAMVAINTFSDHLEQVRTDKIPYGFGIAAAMDTLADGLIIGAGFAASGEAGTFLTIALGLELMTLNLSVANEFLKHGSSRKLTLAVTTGIALMLVIGAIIGTSMFGELDDRSLATVLSISSAAVLYLVAQELLFMGQKIERSSLTIAAFFLGFMVLMAFTLFRLGGN